MIFAFISRQKAEAFLKICSLTYRTFANFLAGQCLESIILGSMFVLKSRYRILGSSTGFVDCTKVLKNLFAMVHQCFDVFFWCGGCGKAFKSFCKAFKSNLKFKERALKVF